MFVLPNPRYEDLPGYGDLLDEIDEQTRLEALRLFLPEFQDRYLRYLAAPERNFEDAGPGAGQLLPAIQRDGCALARIDPGQKAELTAMALPLTGPLVENIVNLPKPTIADAQLILSPEAHPGIFQLVDQIFESTGLVAATRAYLGQPLKLRAATVQVNNVRETSNKYGPIEKDGLPANKARYFHIDSNNWPPLKVIIYLTPVGPDQGPLRYVRGSHRMADPFEIVVRKTNDRLRLTAKQFMALPPPFRMNTHFGDHVPADCEEMARLLRNEFALCDGESDLVVFDNTGVHRGGFVRKGQRFILQCTLCPVE